MSQHYLHDRIPPAGTIHFLIKQDLHLWNTTELTSGKRQHFTFYKKTSKFQTTVFSVSVPQASHLFNNEGSENFYRSENVKLGDLCLFKRTDAEKVLLGTVVQFSYLEGTKKQRQYSSSYVDLTLESKNTIGVFANWFQAKEETSKIHFYPVDAFTVGYLSMENYISTIDESFLNDDENSSFCID